MEENAIFANVYAYQVKDVFKLYFGQNKDREDNFDIEVEGLAYYNCEKPTAKTNCHRYYLELNIKKPNGNKGRLAVIMLNPSNTFPKKGVDATVKNVVRIAYKLGYSSVIILNSFSYIDGNSSTAKKNENNNSGDYNLNIISNVLNENKNLMIAWGTKISKTIKNQILSRVSQIEGINIFAFAWNYNAGCPFHPATRVYDKQNKIHPLTEFLINKSKEVLLVINKCEGIYTLHPALTSINIRKKLSH